ncbi:MAG: cyclic nucleotide-binding domain-containing protein [Chloroflexi bacterium]|nr:cyclic nucleotide-binding domain-containing protein [Chloroflexota bacterium]
MVLKDIPTENMEPWYVTWDLGAETLDKIRAFAKEIELPAGATVFSAGEPADAMYLVLEGMILVLVKDSNGKEQTTSIITEGQSFGEVGLLVDQPRLATTAAGLDSRLLKITSATLDQLEQDNPAIALQIYKVLAKTLAEQWMLVTYVQQNKLGEE